MESSLIRDQTHVPCIGMWNLYHWITREVPEYSFFYFSCKWDYNVLCVYLYCHKEQGFFLWYGIIFLCMYMCISHGHLGYFHILLLQMMLQWVWQYRYLFETVISFPWIDFTLRTETVGSYDSPIFDYLRNPHSVFVRIVPVYTPTDSAQRYPFLHILTNVY